MAWYLVTTAPQELSYWKTTNPEEAPVWVTEMVGINIVSNSIVYDGVSPYTPPENNRLAESSNAYSIGDSFSD